MRPAAVLIAQGQKLWLAPMLLALIAPLFGDAAGARPTRFLRRVLILAGALALPG